MTYDRLSFRLSLAWRNAAVTLGYRLQNVQSRCGAWHPEGQQLCNPGLPCLAIAITRESKAWHCRRDGFTLSARPSHLEPAGSAEHLHSSCCCDRSCKRRRSEVTVHSRLVLIQRGVQMASAQGLQGRPGSTLPQAPAPQSRPPCDLECRRLSSRHASSSHTPARRACKATRAQHRSSESLVAGAESLLLPADVEGHSSPERFTCST